MCIQYQQPSEIQVHFNELDFMTSKQDEIDLLIDRRNQLKKMIKDINENVKLLKCIFGDNYETECVDLYNDQHPNHIDYINIQDELVFLRKEIGKQQRLKRNYIKKQGNSAQIKIPILKKIHSLNLNYYKNMTIDELNDFDKIVELLGIGRIGHTKVGAKYEQVGSNQVLLE